MHVHTCTHTQIHTHYGSNIVCSLAYVSLGLGDPLSALHYSTSLLSSPQLPGGLKYLGHTYAAEALVYLDRVSEALQHLNPDSVNNINISLPPNGQRKFD